MPVLVGPLRNSKKRPCKEISMPPASQENKTKNVRCTRQLGIEDLPTPFSSCKRIRKSVFHGQGKSHTVEDTAKAAVKIFTELLERYQQEEVAIKKERRFDDDAQALAESLMTARYEDLCEAVEGLMPYIGVEPTNIISRDGGPRYRKVQLHGRDVTPKSKSNGSLGARLEKARRQGREGLARDALCATLAALSCRREMCWLEAHDDEEPARGAFAHALVDASSRLRLSFKIDSWRPASLLLTSVLPLEKALSRMDSGGPLKGFHGPLNQKFVLQQIHKGLVLGDGLNEREPLSELKPDAELQALLCSKIPVLMIEAYAALAPRDQVKTHELGDIIKNEFAEVLKKAKAQKQAVVFQLGGNDPHKLAEKVYQKPPFTDYGLRVGYLRWRVSGLKENKWATERPIEDRSCIGLQMP